MITDIMYIVLWVSTIVLILSGLDDVLVDIFFWFNRKKYNKTLPNTKEVDEAPEHPVALVIGCWQEYSVIGRTISLALDKLKYKNYKIFIGVYQNDKKTIAEVKKYSDLDHRVIMCINPKDGPTSKADNLNNVFNCIDNYEKSYGVFSSILIHDSEDFIHPMSLKLYNYLIMYKGYYAVQIPVVPIKSGLGNVFHRTYCDSFAEVHTKDLIVRQSIGSFVPFAGTGMAFNRVAFKYLETGNIKFLEYLKEKFENLKDKKYDFKKEYDVIDHNDDVLFRSFNITTAKDSSSVNVKYIYGDAERTYKIFNDANLTEDYEMGLKFHKLGLQVAFINLILKETGDDFHIATRSYFPNTFWAAVRQKSRWIAGINLQNWKIHQWKGSFVTKWFLMRDRKGLFANMFLLVSFVFFLYAVLNFIDEKQNWDIFKTLLPVNSLLWYILFSVLFFAIVRVFHRFFFTFRWYGLRYALMSFFRLFVDNTINFFATLRALKIYFYTKNKLVWDKTDHY